MKQTTLDLNGPILSFVQQPESVSICAGIAATFVGIATASFPTQTPANPASNTGTLSYQWYAEGYGALSDGSFLGATIAGSATTTLTVSGVDSPTTSGISFYVGVDYVPSAYSQPVGSAVTVGTGRSTANAINEILNSNSAVLVVYPDISITSQPTEQTVAQGRDAIFSVSATSTDPSQDNFSYQWTANGTNLSNGNTTVNGNIVDSASGVTSPQLTISSTTIGIQTVGCIVSHPTACNSPIFTNSVNFNVVSARQIINFEEYTGGQGIIKTEHNLFNGEYSFVKRASLISFYASEKDLDVEMDVYAAAGSSYGSNLGGEGGFSRVRFKMPKDVEFTIAGFNFSETAFIYRGTRLMMVVGAGGFAGPNGPGGPGGGVGIAGGSGLGRGGGSGGPLFAAGTLPQDGLFGSSTGSTPRAPFPLGGRVSRCSMGYWQKRGYSACQDVSSVIGDVKFYLADGTQVNNSASIYRGYGAGLGYRQNAGGGDYGARGGTGATGGSGGVSGGGGGGASGYHDGTIEVIQSTLGGNTNTSAFITIREAQAGPRGFTTNGIYLDLTQFPASDLSLNISTSEESGIFHYINIPGIDNIPENLGSRNYTVQGGRVYGPCTAPNGNLYIGSETPVGGTTNLVVEEGGDDWNDMILSVNQGFFRRISAI